jgi:hypothetical protein
VHVPVQTRGKQRRRSSNQDVSASNEYIRPYRLLAMGVVVRAMLDLLNPGGSAGDRESAQVFLQGSSMLFHWCHVAALDPWCVVTRAEKLTADPALGSRQYASGRRPPIRSSRLTLVPTRCHADGHADERYLAERSPRR